MQPQSCSELHHGQMCLFQQQGIAGAHPFLLANIPYAGGSILKNLCHTEVPLKLWEPLDIQLSSFPAALCLLNRPEALCQCVAAVFSNAAEWHGAHSGGIIWSFELRWAK